MVPGRILIVAAMLAAGLPAQAGESRRHWIDPPRASGPDTAPTAVAPEAWPDEAQRRPVPEPASAATAARAEPPHSPPSSESRVAETLPPVADVTPEPAPVLARPVAVPVISDRTRRRLGVLSGFAGAAAAPEGVGGRNGEQVRGALGRMRILQIRRGRLKVIYTRS